MNSVERILHYCATIPQEATPNPTAVSESWPENGSLVCRKKRGHTKE
jgi:hypothetical protein